MKIKQLIILPLLALAVIFTSCQKEPTAGFNASKPTVFAFEPITFTNTSIDAATYSWDFGDGNTSTLESPTHEFNIAGTYTVTLTATSENGNKTNVTTKTVTVKNGFRYDNVSYTLDKSNLEFYGAWSENPNSYNFDVYIMDNNIDFENETGTGNIVYFEAWSSDTTQLMPGVYNFNLTNNPLSFSTGIFGLNVDLATGTGDILEATAGKLNVAKAGNIYTFYGELTLSNQKTIEFSYKGTVVFTDQTQVAKNKTKKFKK